MAWNKADLINELAAIRGYRSYLEICTPTTGAAYSQVDRSRYTTCLRLMYRCPRGYDDGLAVEFRSGSFRIWRCLLAIRSRRLKFDAILVDPFHEYRQSARDLRAAISLLEPNGTVVMHDCLPESAELAHPTFKPGSWCGVTYKAYLDLVLQSPGLQFCTVDTDHGCGIVRRLHAPATNVAAGRVSGAADAGAGLVQQWQQIGDDYGAAFKLLEAHAGPLLNLVTVEDFLAGERAGAPVLR